MESKLLLEQFAGMVSSADDVPKLNAAILQLAVQGKLTTQEATDEPASALLKRIAVERERLITEKKIRKRKALPDIGDEERPFAIPEGWKWVRLSDVVDFSIGKTPPTKQAIYWEDDGIPWVSISDMDQYGLVKDTKRKISKEAKEKIFRGRISPKGTLLMSFKLTLGKVSILDMDAFHNEAIISIYPFEGINQRYLFRFLPIFVVFGKQKDAIKGATLNSKSLTNLPVPLPPLAEQKRIVERVDTLLAQTSQLKAMLAEVEESLVGLHGAAVEGVLTAVTPQQFADKWQFIANNFDTFYDEAYPKAALANVAALKQTILQLAVQGKLTRQDPADEPASVLLERIAAEKARLVAEKKIRKGKVLPEIGDEERPFVLPDGWEWVRMGVLSTSIQTGPFGSALHKSDYVPNGIPVINPASIKVEKIIPLSKMMIDEKTRERLSNYVLKEGDIVMGRRGEMGRCALVTEVENGWLCGTGSLILRFSEDVYKTFIVKLIGSAQVKSYLMGSSVGSTMNNLNHRILNNLIIGLPPLAEQKRIVARVNSLLALCDDLAAHLRAAQAAQVALRDVVVG